MLIGQMGASRPLTQEELNRVDPKLLSAAKAAQEDLSKYMSPAGALGLEPHLDERRLQYNIPDAAFMGVAPFSRIVAYAITSAYLEYESVSRDVKIFAPDSMRETDRVISPRIVIISAGLLARDQLLSNGIELGDIAYCTRAIPFRIELGFIGGKMREVMLLEAGDVTMCEDTARRLRAGEIRIATETSATGRVSHFYEKVNSNAE